MKDHQCQRTQIHAIPPDTSEHPSNNHGSHIWCPPTEGRCRLEKNSRDDEQPFPVESGVKLAERKSKDDCANCEPIFGEKKGIWVFCCCSNLTSWETCFSSSRTKLTPQTTRPIDQHDGTYSQWSFFKRCGTFLVWDYPDKNKRGQKGLRSILYRHQIRDNGIVEREKENARQQRNHNEKPLFKKISLRLHLIHSSFSLKLGRWNWSELSQPTYFETDNLSGWFHMFRWFTLLSNTLLHI